jgi:hypothetical protein
MPAKGVSGKNDGKSKQSKKDSKPAAKKRETEIYIEGTLEVKCETASAGGFTFVSSVRRVHSCAACVCVPQKRCEGNLLRKWQPRYCVFSAKGLMYFKSKEEHAAKKEPTLIPTAAFRNCSVSGLEILLHTQVCVATLRNMRESGRVRTAPAIHAHRSRQRDSDALVMRKCAAALLSPTTRGTACCCRQGQG